MKAVLDSPSKQDPGAKKLFYICLFVCFSPLQEFEEMILRQKPDNVDWMTSKKEKIKRGKPCWKKRRKWWMKGQERKREGRFQEMKETPWDQTLGDDF